MLFATVACIYRVVRYDFSALCVYVLQEQWFWVQTVDSLERHHFVVWLFASFSLILSKKVSKCGLASCVDLLASATLPKRCIISFAEKWRPFYHAYLRPAENLWWLFSKLSWTPFPPYWLKLLLPVWKVESPFFLNWSCSEGQLSSVHLLNRKDRETTNFLDESSPDGNSLTPASLR